MFFGNVRFLRIIAVVYNTSDSNLFGYSLFVSFRISAIQIPVQDSALSPRQGLWRVAILPSSSFTSAICSDGCPKNVITSALLLQDLEF